MDVKLNREKILVQKFGGSSVRDADRMRRVAERVKSYYEKGYHLVVVVSAMGDTTDDLIDLAAQVSDNPPKREMDMLLSTGEQVSASVLAITLNTMGVPAISFNAQQVKIHTDATFNNARIKKIDTERLTKAMAGGYVCIVTGFQGVDEELNITTLGRGGSDTSAVALAAVLQAKECEIYTDVDGVYTGDPNKIKGTRKRQKISYDEMMELASLGAGVLHSRCVEFARKYGVVIHVRSSFNLNQGTLVVEESQIMEKLLVSGVSLKTDEARVSLSDIPDRPGIAAEVFQALAEPKINVDIIVQSTGRDGKNTIAFTIPKKDLRETRTVLDSQLNKWGSGIVSYDENIAVVSAVGIGMKSQSGVAASMFSALAAAGINIEMITTSEIKISCVISKDHGKQALQIVHDIFGLTQTP